MALEADFWLGMADGHPTDWDGRKRRCFVIGRPQLATGSRAWRVEVRPALPVPMSTRRLSEVVVAERYVGESLEGLRGDWVTVNVAGYASTQVQARERFADGDLDLLYVAEAAPEPSLLPEEFDVQRFFEQTLARIERFIARHGHSRVPEGYHDEDGRLEIIVNQLRFEYSGKAGVGDGTFPGVDYVAALEALPGWEWEWETDESDSPQGR